MSKYDFNQFKDIDIGQADLHDIAVQLNAIEPGAGNDFISNGAEPVLEIMGSFPLLVSGGLTIFCVLLLMWTVQIVIKEFRNPMSNRKASANKA